MKFAFLMSPAVSHTNFLSALAIKAKNMGDEVIIYLPGTKNTLIRKIVNNPALKIDIKLEEIGLACRLIPLSLYQGMLGEKIKKKRGLEETLFALKVFSAGAKKYTNYLVNEFKKEKPTAIIYDYTFFPAIAVSEKLNIPRIAIYHSGLPFLEYPIPPMGSQYKYGEISQTEFDDFLKLRDEEEAKAKNKFEEIIKQKIEIDFLASPSSDILNIANSIKETEYPRKELSDNIHFVGSSILDNNNLDDELPINNQEKKLIYVSLGTVFNKQPDLFIKIINSIDIPNVEIIVSSGASYKKLKSCKFNPNVHIKKFISNVFSVLKNSEVFITHGGKNSINEALKFGVPMILFPAGGEQEYNANLVEYHHLGKNFSNIMNDFTNKDMNDAIKFLLNDKQVRNSVETMVRKHENIDGASNTYELIKKLNF